jgi:hypothetical protein
MFYYVKVLVSDLYQRRFKMGRSDRTWSVISNRYWNLTLEELKCPILILQRFKTPWANHRCPINHRDCRL